MKKNTSGFTLVEIMIVVVIIGLLAAMAIPAFQKVRSESQASRIANDMNKVAHAFDVILMEDDPPVGIYTAAGGPSGFNAADIPKVMLKKPYGEDSSFSYDISAGLTGVGNTGVVLTKVADWDNGVAVALDDILDDGDLATGRGRLLGKQYVLIVGAY